MREHVLAIPSRIPSSSPLLHVRVLHSQVPRLTINSLKQLSEQVQRMQAAQTDEAAPAAAGGFCSWWPCGRRRPADRMTERAPLIQPGAAVPPDEIAAQPSQSQSGLQMSDDFSSAMQPMAQMEHAAATPGDSLHTAAQQTVTEQKEAESLDFATRLRATGVPEPVVRRVMETLKTAGVAWTHPSQELVAPGRIYYLQRLQPPASAGSGAASQSGAAGEAATGEAGGALPSSGSTTSHIMLGMPASAPGQAKKVVTTTLEESQTPGVGRATLITVDDARRYTVQRISPALLRSMILSETMVTDHVVINYRQGILSVRGRGGSGTSGQ